MYFPDKFPVGKGPPRQYFFDILNTVYPDYLKRVMSHANDQRMAASSQNMKEQSIEISQFWEEELRSMPYLSCKSSIISTLINCVVSIKRKMVRHSIFLNKVQRRSAKQRKERRLKFLAPSTTTGTQRRNQDQIHLNSSNF